MYSRQVGMEYGSTRPKFGRELLHIIARLSPPMLCCKEHTLLFLISTFPRLPTIIRKFIILLHLASQSCHESQRDNNIVMQSLSRHISIIVPRNIVFSSPCTHLEAVLALSETGCSHDNVMVTPLAPFSFALLLYLHRTHSVSSKDCKEWLVKAILAEKIEIGSLKIQFGKCGVGVG